MNVALKKGPEERRCQITAVIYDRRARAKDQSHKEVAEDRRLKMLLHTLGPIADYLISPGVTDIILNPDGQLWIEEEGKGKVLTGDIIKPDFAETVIKIIATTTEQTVSRDNPILSAEIPGCGYRFEGNLPPIVKNPTFCIRKPASRIYTLWDYVANHIMTEQQRNEIVKAVKKSKNILVVGGTGSGKTTLSNAILQEIGRTEDRIIILEDTRELQCQAEDVTFIRSTENVGMTRLLKSCMRQYPDRIVVGEVRGGEALALLKAWNTGHPGGLATLHANNATAGLTRLEQLIQEAIMTPQRDLIGEAIDLIVFITKQKNKRIVKELIKVKGTNANQEYQLERV